MQRAVIRVLVVEDFEPFEHFICSTLKKRSQLQVICKAQDGAEAVLQAQKQKPDLIVIDVGLPKIHGIEAVRQIREYLPKSIVLFVSQNSDAEVVDRAFDVGARGYVLKAQAGSDLLAAVDAVLHGQKFISEGLGRKRLTSPETTSNLSPSHNRSHKFLKKVKTAPPTSHVSA